MNIITPSSISNLRSPNSALIPLPELPIIVRLGTMDDIPFIDELQKKNNRSLGFMFRKALEGKIKRDEILIAETGGRSSSTAGSGDGDGGPSPSKLGYLIGNDRYAKRDELGCIFQLCVVPGKRRGLVGATLLKSLFDRASYGCRLYCCWCAQDLEANHFWEAMGFVPVAFRSGAKKKLKGKDGKLVDRVHIFWQKRIRTGDTTTPYWYPHETGGGAINEDRIVLPIPPNVHWSEVKSVVVPGEDGGRSSPTAGLLECAGDGQSPETAGEDARPSKPKRERKTQRSAPSTSERNAHGQHSKKQPYTLHCGSAIYFAAPVVEEPKVEKARKEKAPKVKAEKVKRKNDPEKVKAARYIRDRYTEEINRGDYLVSNGKYEVSRLVENAPVPVGRLTVETCVGSPHQPPTTVPLDQKLLAA